MTEQALAQVRALCDEWDALSKGETGTTARIRQAATVERYPCGHDTPETGCGGCDPGAIEYVIEDGTATLRPYDPAQDLQAQPLPHESTAEVPDWHCTNSARGEGWGTRGDCPYCGHYMFDGTESVTVDAYREHYATCPALDHSTRP